jgi:hypothetical protein
MLEPSVCSRHVGIPIKVTAAPGRKLPDDDRVMTHTGWGEQTADFGDDEQKLRAAPD